MSKTISNQYYDVEYHPLSPFLPKNSNYLILGSFPPPSHRWKMDFYYPNFQNDMWRIMGLIFFKDKNYFIHLEQKTFKVDDIKQFLTQQGIAIFDVATAVQRLKSNASDAFLQIVQTTDLAELLAKIPNCQHIITTGEKATTTVLQSYPSNTKPLKMGETRQLEINHCKIYLHRLPSSSWAYPMKMEDKANYYRAVFCK